MTKTDEAIELLEISKNDNSALPAHIIDWIIERLKKCRELEVLKSWEENPERMGK